MSSGDEAYGAEVDAAMEAALRAIQTYDEVAPALPRARVLLVAAETALGEALGLGCTGEDEGDGHYRHNVGTCPVHEWLYPEDQPLAARLYGSPTTDLMFLDLDERSVVKAGLRFVKEQAENHESDIADRLLRRLGGYKDD